MMHNHNYIHYTVYTMQYTVYTAQCTVYTIQYALDIVSHKIYSLLAVKKAGHLNINTKMTSEYSQREFVHQPVTTRASKLFLC